MEKVRLDEQLLLRTMLLAREGDRHEGVLSRTGKGWFQVSGTGHEALAALGLLTTEQDWIFPHYRDRALLLGRGLQNVEFARIFFAKKTASSGGRQIPGHYSARELNVWSMPSPVAANLLPACGAAWSLKLRGLPGVVLACCGDGGMRQGEFYEAVCFARERQLPVVFVVEDNGYGISTATHDSNPLRNGLFAGDTFRKVAGHDAREVARAGAEALTAARSGSGPQLLWIELDRLCSHSSSDDQRNYRTAQEIEAMLAREPVATFAQKMLSEGKISAEQWEAMQQEIAAEVEADYLRAEAEESPKPEEIHQHLMSGFAPLVEPLPELDCNRMVDAVNGMLRAALGNDSRVVLFGEDIADPMGGVFKLTRGLSSEFPERVFNSPLAEATILGVACGLASAGMRPIFELQFIDFITPGWNQLVNNIATLRWRSRGQWSCPVVLYAPSGAYLPGGGPWHSQSLASALVQQPGLCVVEPSTAEDAAGFFSTALRSEDPVVILLPKHLLRQRQIESGAAESVPLGVARRVRAGAELTLVCWGNCVELAQQAAEELPFSVEIIDLRSLSPWDRETVTESVRKTGRLLVVQEDNRACSMGERVIATLLADRTLWAEWQAPPQLVCREDVHVAYHPAAEYASLPDLPRICTAAREIMAYEAPRIGARNGSAAPTDFSSYNTASFQPTTSHTTSELAHSMQTDSTSENSAPFSPRVAIRIPALGEGLQEARVVMLLKKPGEPVKRNEIIYQIETDKAVVDIESPEEGTLSSWCTEPETTVGIGTVIGYIDTPKEGKAAKSHAVISTPAQVSSSSTSAPQAQALYIEKDHPEYDEVVLPERQQALASRLVRASQVAVPATVMQTVSWEGIATARAVAKQHAKTEAITSFTLLAWSVTRALKQHPAFRSFLPRHGVLRVYRKVNLGIAVALPDDQLTTAVVENVDDLDLATLAKTVREQIANVRTNDEEAKNKASLILTSMTAFDISHGVPVIVPPSVATLLVSSPYEQLVRQADGEIGSKQLVNLSLTFDHRAINGVGAAAFINSVRCEMEEMTEAVEALRKLQGLA